MPNELPIQNYKNHSRAYPPYHYVLAPLLLFNLIWTVVRLVKYPSSETAMSVLVAVCLILLAFVARTFALKVQDRVIRLEMRLRLRELLPPDLAPRIKEFTIGQLIALRFAGDADLPALARKVLDEKLEDQKAIKTLIKNWEGDYLRA
jgi:hypothetical protein